MAYQGSYNASPEVKFISYTANKKYEWNGKITRVAGSIDPPTRLVYVYAEVLNPYDQTPPLAIGMFVDAEIEGKKINDAFLIPNSAVTNNTSIYSIDDENYLRIKKIEILGVVNDYLVVKGDIKENMRVVASPLNDAEDGMALTPILLDKNIDG